MGADAIEPFVDAARATGAGVLVLVRTSNPGAADVEDLALADGGRVWERVAELVSGWGGVESASRGSSDVGAVLGATEPQHLVRARELMAARALPAARRGRAGRARRGSRAGVRGRTRRRARERLAQHRGRPSHARGRARGGGQSRGRAPARDRLGARRALRRGRLTGRRGRTGAPTRGRWDERPESSRAFASLQVVLRREAPSGVRRSRPGREAR